MDPALLVKLRPTGPWRTGSESGAHGEIDPVYHSDALYSAVCSAFLSLGTLSEWLEATALRAGDPAVRLSSLFPSAGGMLFVTPPRSAWPPMAGAPLHVPKVRWKAARFVPVELLPRILGGAVPDEDRWAVDAHSGCLVPAGQSGPYRAGVRFGAAVDRLSGAAEPHLTACLEFSPDADSGSSPPLRAKAAQPAGRTGAGSRAPFSRLRIRRRAVARARDGHASPSSRPEFCPTSCCPA